MGQRSGKRRVCRPSTTHTGTQPPATSLGVLLHDAQAYAVMKPGLLVVPGFALLLIVLLLNIASRGLRDTVDPALGTEAADGAA